MRTIHMLNDSQSLRQWCAIAQPGERILHVTNGMADLRLAHRKSVRQWVLPAHWSGLLVTQAGMTCLAGEAQVRPLQGASLLQLQFFIDQALVPPLESVPPGPLATLADAAGGPVFELQLEQAYLACVTGQCADYQAFAQLLRSTESYRLVNFLSDNCASSDKLQQLAERYGVSVSHFRRLCRHALGGTVKTGLRQWRTARALLALTEAYPSLTDIALQLGYASSSHFSKEFKELVGIVPSRLIDLARLPRK